MWFGVVLIIIFAVFALCDWMIIDIRKRVGLSEIKKTKLRYSDNREQKKRDFRKNIRRRFRKQKKRFVIGFTACVLINIVIISDSLFFKSQSTGYREDIYISENDEKKEIYELFKEDDTPDEEEVMEEEYQRYRMLLHYDWLQGYDDINDITPETVRQYNLNVFACAHPPEMKEDVPMRSLDDEEKKKVAEYADIVDTINRKGKNRTPEESEQEYRAYWDSYCIRPVAEMAFQAGRAREDYYWNNYGNMETEEKLQTVAEMIEAFDTFLQHDNKVVWTEDGMREVSEEEILYREGKVLYHLGKSLETGMPKLHFSLYAQGCFSYVDGAETEMQRAYQDAPEPEEVWKIGGYYYSGQVIKVLLSIEIANAQMCEHLLEEGEKTCDEAIATCEKLLQIPRGTLETYSDDEIDLFQSRLAKRGWAMEPQMLRKILEIKGYFISVEKYLRDMDWEDPEGTD